MEVRVRVVRGIINIIIGFGAMMMVGSGRFEYKIGGIGALFSLGLVALGIWQIYSSVKSKESRMVDEDASSDTPATPVTHEWVSVMGSDSPATAAGDTTPAAPSSPVAWEDLPEEVKAQAAKLKRIYGDEVAEAYIAEQTGAAKG